MLKVKKRVYLCFFDFFDFFVFFVFDLVGEAHATASAYELAASRMSTFALSLAACRTRT